MDRAGPANESRDCPTTGTGSESESRYPGGESCSQGDVPTPGVIPTSCSGRSSREVLLWVGVAVAVAVVFAPVIAHPTEVLYSPHSDILSQHYPFRYLMVDSLHRYGRLPWWNPTAFCGMPLAGDPQAGLYYPPNWLHALVSADKCASMFGFVILLHVLLGGWGMLWWLRGQGFGPAARLAGALAFAFCGKWLYHLLVPGHVIFLPFAWMPWQCGMIDRLWDRPTLRNALLLGLFTGIAVLGYHPQLLVYSHVLLVIYAVFVGLTSRQRQRGPYVHALLRAAQIAVMISVAQLVPAIWVLDADFFVRSQGLPYEQAARRSLRPEQLITILLPSEAGKGLWETTSYVGVVAGALALFGWTWRRRRPQVIFWLAVVGFCLWFALGENGGLHRFLYDYVPGSSWFRIPPRLLLVLGLPVGYLAAAGIAGLSERPHGWAARLLAGAFVVGALVLVWKHPTVEAIIAAAGLTVPLLCLLPWPSRAQSVLVAFVLLALFADQARFALPKVQTRSLTDALGVHPLVKQLGGPLGRQRVLAVNQDGHPMYNSLPIAYCTTAGIESVRGFNPLIPRCTFQYLAAGVGQQSVLNWPFDRTGIPKLPLKSRKHLDLLNVRWIVSNQPIDLEGLVKRETLDDLKVYHFLMKHGGLVTMPTTYLYENTAVLPRAMLVRHARAVKSVESAIEQIATTDLRQEVLVENPTLAGSYPGEPKSVDVDHRGDEILLSVDAGKGGYLVLSEMWYPAWHAESNGVPIPVHRANGVFQVLQLPAGQHQIRLRFETTWLTGSKWLTLLSLIFVVLVIVVSGIKRVGERQQDAQPFADRE